LTKPLRFSAVLAAPTIACPIVTGSTFTSPPTSAEPAEPHKFGRANAVANLEQTLPQLVSLFSSNLIPHNYILVYYCISNRLKIYILFLVIKKAVCKCKPLF